MRLHAVLDQARILPQLVRRVRVDSEDLDAKLLTFRVLDDPQLFHPIVIEFGVDQGGVGRKIILRGDHREGAGRGHPIQGLVGAVVGVNRDRSIGFDHDESVGLRQVRLETPDIIHTATGDD